MLLRSGWATGGGVVVAVVFALGAVLWTVVASGYESLGPMLRNSVFVQAVFGTSVASVLASALCSVKDFAKAWAAGTLCTTFKVSAANQGTLYLALRKYMVKCTKVHMPLATATLSEDGGETVSALERFALMRRGLEAMGKAKTKTVHYTTTPAELPVACVHQGIRLLLTINTDEVTVYAPGRGHHAVIKSFLQQVVDEDGGGGESSAPGKPEPPSVYMPTFDREKGTASWKQVRELRPRSRATLFLPNTMLRDFIKDAEEFFTGAAEYERRQQPFRRGWVLHGPPGTGKSTVPLVVATELGLPLCLLDISNPDVTDEGLRSLLNAAPIPSLVVLEDVDAASASTHSRGIGPATAGGPDDGYGYGYGHGHGDAGPHGGAHEGEDARRFVHRAVARPSATLAGLLNALDGLGAHEGHLVIMTTNDIERLDPALIRPGRCDMKAFMPLATASQVRDMLLAEFPHATPEDVENFGAIVRPGRFSPAAISEYLTRVRGDLATAVSEKSLETMRVASLGITVHGVVTYCNVFNLLWAGGLEALFPAALEQPALFPNQLLPTRSAVMALDPSLRAAKDKDHRPVLVGTKVALLEYFLGWFPRQRAHAVAFAAKVLAWSAAHGHRHLGLDRLTRHLHMNFDDPAKAVASAEEWLLTYPRDSANVREALAVEYALFVAGLHLSKPAEFAAMVRDLALGPLGDSAVTGDTLILDVRGTSYKDFEDARPEYKAAFKLFKNSFVRDVDAIDRVTIAVVFCNAYDYQGCTLSSAMDAARQVSAPDGRSGFTHKTLASYVCTSRTLDECVSRMLGAIVDFRFPSLYLPAPMRAARHGSSSGPSSGPSCGPSSGPSSEPSSETPDIPSHQPLPSMPALNPRYFGM